MAAVTLGRAVVPCSVREVAERPQPSCLQSSFLSQIPSQRLASANLSSSSTHRLDRLPTHSSCQWNAGPKSVDRLAVRASTTTAAVHTQLPAKLAVFVSGGGSNFKTIHAGIKEGRINGEVVAVVSDKPGEKRQPRNARLLPTSPKGAEEKHESERTSERMSSPLQCFAAKHGFMVSVEKKMSSMTAAGTGGN